MQGQNKKIDSFTKLDAWRASHRLAIKVFLTLEGLPKNDSLRNQAERSALSITSNIAEGFGRQSLADKRHFYIMARGSAYELQNQLLLAKDIGKINKHNFEELAVLSLDSIKLLHGLIRALSKNANS